MTQKIELQSLVIQLGKRFKKDVIVWSNFTSEGSLGQTLQRVWKLRFETSVKSLETEDTNLMSEADDIKSPDHYAQFDIEPIIFIQRNRFEFWRGNVIKYVCRAGYKDVEIKDLQKAKRYIEMRINELMGKEINE